MNKYAIFGNPIQHSLSPLIHYLFAEQFKKKIIYTSELIALDSFKQTLKTFQGMNGKGINVTAPFKVEAYHAVDTLTDRARAAQAVNTIIFHDDGTLEGDNTDGVGFIRDFVSNLNQTINGKRILILGAGGAIRGILPFLLEQQPREIIIANRTHQRVVDLIQSTVNSSHLFACELSEVYHATQGMPVDIIINGINSTVDYPNNSLDARVMTPTTFCYDLIYSVKSLTPFLLAMERQGIKYYADGKGMLVEQAAEAFYVWHGVRPNTHNVIAQVCTL